MFAEERETSNSGAQNSQDDAGEGESNEGEEQNGSYAGSSSSLEKLDESSAVEQPRNPKVTFSPSKASVMHSRSTISPPVSSQEDAGEHAEDRDGEDNHPLMRQ